MTTSLIYDRRFCEHHTGQGHPERAERLRAIVHRLNEDLLWERLQHLPIEPVPMKWIERIHEGEYIDRLRDACQCGDPFIDAVDSAICPHSYNVAILAVGGLLAASDAVMDGRVRNVFCAVRPPGHHTEADRSMGFCLFNTPLIT